MAQVQVDNAIVEELWPGEIEQAVDTIRQFTRWSSLYQPLQWSTERDAKVKGLAQLLESKLQIDESAKSERR